MGQVQNINKDDIELVLPNKLSGFIPLTSLSDKISDQISRSVAEEERVGNEFPVEDRETTEDVDLSSLFTVGQYLRAYVVATGDKNGKRHIELSINPRHTNTGLTEKELVVNSIVQASVQSVEDHGLVMSLGLEDQSTRGFVSSKEVGSTRSISNIKIGAVYLCLITGLSSNGKIVKLSADPQRIGNIKKTNFLQDAPTVDAYLPGTAVEMLVSEVTNSGVLGKVMGLLDVTSDYVHSGASSFKKSIAESYVVGSKVKGRIIYSIPGTGGKSLGVSLLDHIMYFAPALANKDMNQAPLDTLPVSTIVEKVQVTKVQAVLGLFVDLGIKGIQGFVHISRITNGRIESLSETTGPYKVGSVHRGRVLGYNPIDAQYLVSLQPSIIDLPFLRLEDVAVGQVVTGKIEKLIVKAEGVSGLIVKLTDAIDGLVPSMHFADIKLQHPERKFKEGMSVKARVLEVDLEKRQMRLTLKKSLVNSDTTPFLSYETLEVGMQSPGTIINLLPTGAVVQFYSFVRGFLPIQEMSETFIKDTHQHFSVGQVVNVRIIAVSPAEKRMTVSCRDASKFGAAQRIAFQLLDPGTIVSGTVSEKTSDTIVVQLDDSALQAQLPFEHLTDGSEQKCVSAAKRIRVGQKLQDLIVLKVQSARKLIGLSTKPSLVKAAKSGSLLLSIENVVPETEVIGFVRNVTDAGVFVEFAGELVGILPKSHITSDLLLLPDFGFRRDQSITAIILSVDYNTQKFVLTQKRTELLADGSPSQKPQSEQNTLLSEPVDGASKSTNDFTVGMITKVRIKSVRQTQLNVEIAKGFHGRIDISEVFDKWEDIQDVKNPLQAFKGNQIIDARVLGYHDSKNHRFLPITHRNKRSLMEFSAKPSTLIKSELEILTLDQIQVDSVWTVFVNNVDEHFLWVSISPNIRGRIGMLDASHGASLLSNLEGSFPLGSALRARVTGIDLSKAWLELTLRLDQSSVIKSIDDLSKGMIVPGKVTRVAEGYIVVQVSDDVAGPVFMVDMADDYAKANPADFQRNQIIRVCVGDVDLANKRFTLSTRPSKVLSSSLPVVDREVSFVAQLKVNDIVRGFVSNVAENGVFVRLGSTISAYVRIADLSDAYLKDWKADFHVDQLVQGKIISVDVGVGQVKMSLKKSLLSKDYKPLLTVNELKIGQVVTAKVRKVEDYGVFIVVDDSVNVSGLCHRSELADRKVPDVKKLYSEGDAVKAKVLKVDLEKRRIAFGLKASYFKDEDQEEDDEDRVVIGDDEVESDDESDRVDGVQLDNDKDMPDAESEGESIDLDNVRGIDSDDQASNVGAPAPSALSSRFETGGSTFKGLSTGGFDWTGGITHDEPAGAQSDTSADSTMPKKKKKRRKAEVKQDLTSDLDANGPQSVTDYERLLMSQPNSSYLWLRYMAYYLESGDIGKAREIAERAIQTINSIGLGAGESESLNVWIGLMNLENTYGTQELDEVFRRACEVNDSEEVHNRLVSIYIQSGKNEVRLQQKPLTDLYHLLYQIDTNASFQQADTLLQSMLKKFPPSPKIYLNYLSFLYTPLSSPSAAPALLPPPLHAHHPNTHLDLTTQAAQMEFKYGDPERGRTLFEGLLGTWPKRLDLWIVLADAEIRIGEKQRVRDVFERALKVKTKPRNAKFLFKKWIAWEDKVGDQKSQDVVKAKAREYVKMHGGKVDEK